MPSSAPSGLASKGEGPGGQVGKAPAFRRAVVPARAGVPELVGCHSFPGSEGTPPRDVAGATTRSATGASLRQELSGCKPCGLENDSLRTLDFDAGMSMIPTL